jgi:hypothetical protein
VKSGEDGLQKKPTLLLQGSEMIVDAPPGEESLKKNSAEPMAD